MIDFECPNCGALQTVADSAAGTELSCPSCHALLEIPRLDEFAEAPPSSGPEYVGTPVDESSSKTIQLTREGGEAGGKDSGTVEVGGSADTIQLGREDVREDSTIAVGRPVKSSSETIQLGGEEATGAAGIQPGEAAYCARHPEDPAHSICARCGNFMCSQCDREGRRKNCPACRKRVGDSAASFPFNRKNWTLNRVFDFSWKLFKRQGTNLVVGYLVTFAAAFGIGFIGQFLQVAAAATESIVLVIGVQLSVTLLQNILSGILGIGFARLLLDAALRRKVDIGTIFSQFYKIGTYVLQLLAVIGIFLIPTALYIGVFVVIGLLAGAENNPELMIALGAIATVIGIVPYVYFMLPLMFIGYELAYNDDVGPVESISNCFQIVRGQRLYVFGMVMLAGLIAMAGMLLCGCGMIASVPLSQLIIAVLYLALRNGSGLPPVNLSRSK